MTRFIIRRLLYLVIVLLIITLVTYVIFFAGNSNDLAARFAGRDASPQEIKDAAIRLGLNHGFWYQYWHYLVGLLHGSFGLDFQNQVPINSKVAAAMVSSTMRCTPSAAVSASTPITPGSAVSVMRSMACLSSYISVRIWKRV